MNNKIYKKITKYDYFFIKTNNIFNLILLQFKTIFSSPLSIFMIFIIPNILLFGISVLIPSVSLLASAFGLSITMIIGLLFGDLYYSLETTTLKKNASLLNINNRTKIFSIFMTIFILVIASMTLELLVFIIFETIGLPFMDNFWFLPADNRESLDIIWKNMKYGNLYYYFIMIFIVNFVVFGFLRFFFKSGKTFQMFVLIYWFMTLLFGGVVKATYLSQYNGQPVSFDYLTQGKITNPYKNWFGIIGFLTPSYFLNQQMFSALSVGSQHTLDYFGYGIENMPNNGEAFQLENSNIWVTYDYCQIIFDKYSVSQGWEYGTPPSVYLSSSEYMKFLWADIRSIDSNINYFALNGDWTWDMCVLLPFAYMFLLSVPTFFLVDKRNLIIG